MYSILPRDVILSYTRRPRCASEKPALPFSRAFIKEQRLLLSPVNLLLSE
uniref:Uncharacterized protein n=1 Tax=Erwinia amylovora TaxID=552 RepID=Q9F800_ERWAM|nr:unknown [Erwinia amylovora]